MLNEAAELHIRHIRRPLGKSRANPVRDQSMWRQVMRSYIFVNVKFGTARMTNLIYFDLSTFGAYLNAYYMHFIYSYTHNVI